MTITYNPSTNFGQKDALPVNDPDKVIYGAEFTTEFNAITTAFASAAPTNSPTFTGTITFSGDVALNGSVEIDGESVSATDVQGWNATKATVDAGSANWDTAFGWGNHASEGYLTSFTETDPTVPAHVKSITTTEKANWNTAYGWGDHAAAGYTTTDTTYSGGTNITLSGTTFNLDASLTGLTDVTTSAVSIGSWEIKLDGNDLRFIYNGTDRIRFTTSGAIVAENNITAYGSA